MRRRVLFVLAAIFITSVSVEAAQPTAYVINTTAETLSKIDLTSGTVTNNILPLGSDIDCFPNQIAVRDTLAYVLNSGTDEIQVIDLNSESTIGWIQLDPGSNPYWMAFLDQHYMYVTLLVANSVAKVDLTTNQVVGVVEVGQSPEGIVIWGSKAYIAITAYDFATWLWGQGKVVVYDTDKEELTGGEILTSTNPQFIDVDRRGILHVVCTGNYWDISGVVHLIDPRTNTITETIELGGAPGQIAVSPDDVAWLAAGGWADDGEVYAYNSATYEVYYNSADPLPVDSGATSVAVFQDSTCFVLTFDDIISRHDGTGMKLTSYSLGDGPNHMDFNYVPGDINGDWEVNIGDAVYLLNHIFHNGPRPLFPAWRGDTNADGNINIGDAVYLLSYIFKQGAGPRIGKSWLR